MLGIVARSGVDASLLRDFKILSREGRLKDGSRGEHPSGWGIVYFENSLPAYAGRRPQSAWEDEKSFERACLLLDEKQPRVVVAHVRKASMGSCSLENTHPFVKDGWCFAHNGTIYYRPEELGGRIDSEKFFFEIIARMEKGGGVVDAVSGAIQVARELRNERGEKSSSLTFLLANSAGLYAYREYSVAPEYYNMFYNMTSKMAVATQETEWLEEKIPRGWHELKNKEFLVVDAYTLKSKRVKIR